MREIGQEIHEYDSCAFSADFGDGLGVGADCDTRFAGIPTVGAVCFGVGTNSDLIGARRRTCRADCDADATASNSYRKRLGQCETLLGESAGLLGDGVELSAEGAGLSAKLSGDKDTPTADLK